MSDTVPCPTCGEALRTYGQELLDNGQMVFIWRCIYGHWWRQTLTGWQPTEPLPEIAI